MKKMSYPEFKERISQLHEAYSTRDRVKYSGFEIVKDNLIYCRESTRKQWKMNLKELYNAYFSLDYYTPGNLLEFVPRQGSPAYAILIDIEGVGVSGSVKQKPIPLNSNKTDKADNAEFIFYKNLQKVIGEDFVRSKSLGKPVHSSDILIVKDFYKNGYPKEINENLTIMLMQMKSSLKFEDESLAQYIDGMILSHPLLGTRIIEFDEEQHFTFFRLHTLLSLKKMTNNQYFEDYISICNDIKYVNEKVLPKHRIKFEVDNAPKAIDEFINFIQMNETKIKKSNYVKIIDAFNYLGGRMAQRAYYDVLRDLSHLSDGNKHFFPAIRFSMYEFEKYFHKNFFAILDDEIQLCIKQKLKHYE